MTEYQRHRLVCQGCGETTCAALPAGVPAGQAGPRLVALTALLMGCYRQSESRTAETCRQQTRNAFDYLTRALEARFAALPAPPLLPGA